MHSKELVDGHLESLEAIAFDPQPQALHHDLLAYLVLLRKIGGINCLKTRLPSFEIFGLLGDMRERQVAPAIVVAIISDDGGEFGCLAHFVVPLVRQKLVELLAALFEAPIIIRAMRQPWKWW
jgi:hypothetical protein